MTRRMLLHSLFCSVAALGCGAPTAPGTAADAMRVSGTVHFFSLEGGFWAIRGDDGVIYDPKDGLPPAFQREGMRLSAVLKIPPDLGGIHMVGPIVEIIDINSL